MRSEPGEDIPRQYSNVEGHLTPHTPQNDNMRLEPTLNVTPEGSLTDIPTVMEREARGTSSETAFMGLPNTYVETRLKESERPTTLCGTKETSQSEVLASTKQFFANIAAREQRYHLKLMIGIM